MVRHRGTKLAEKEGFKNIPSFTDISFNNW
jgi:hypothetical protein